MRTALSITALILTLLLVPSGQVTAQTWTQHLTSSQKATYKQMKASPAWKFSSVRKGIQARFKKRAAKNAGVTVFELDIGKGWTRYITSDIRKDVKHLQALVKRMPRMRRALVKSLEKRVAQSLGLSVIELRSAEKHKVTYKVRRKKSKDWSKSFGNKNAGGSLYAGCRITHRSSNRAGTHHNVEEVHATTNAYAKAKLFGKKLTLVKLSSVAHAADGRWSPYYDAATNGKVSFKLVLGGLTFYNKQKSRDLSWTKTFEKKVYGRSKTIGLGPIDVKVKAKIMAGFQTTAALGVHPRTLSASAQVRTPIYAYGIARASAGGDIASLSLSSKLQFGKITPAFTLTGSPHSLTATFELLLESLALKIKLAAKAFGITYKETLINWKGPSWRKTWNIR